jgi:cyclopropane fatty-acyl-phospholipid synthase-like methyltransferase
MKYEQSISRIGDRPGAGLQQWLAKRTVKRFLGNEKSAIVLEIGTGVGRIADEVSRLGFAYIGVEPTESLRSATEQRLTQLNTNNAVIDSSLPELHGLDNDYFTHALAVHVLEHATSAESAAEWIEGITRKVKVGGRILIVCPNFLDLKGHFFDTDWTHQWVSTTSRIAVLGEELGLKVKTETDLRFTYGNIFARSILAAFSKFFPTQLMNGLFRRVFGLRNFGSGIQTALFWRMSWVEFEKV